MSAQLNALGIQSVMAVFCQSEPVSGTYRSNGDCRLVVTHGRREVALSVCRPDLAPVFPDTVYTQYSADFLWSSARCFAA